MPDIVQTPLLRFAVNLMNNKSNPVAWSLSICCRAVQRSCAAHGGFVLSVCRSRFACSARSLDGFPALIHRLSSGLSHSSATSLIKSGPPHVPALQSVRSYTVCAVLPPMYRWIIWPIPTRTAATDHSNIIKVFKYY